VTERGAAFSRPPARRASKHHGKRADSVYSAGRTRDWLKIKCQRRQEFVIGGYTKPEGSRQHFGALHLGVYDKGRLVYVAGGHGLRH